MNSSPVPSRGLTIAQLILSIVGAALALLGVFLLAAILVASPLLEEIPSEQVDPLQSMLWIAVLMVLITIPSLVLSVRRLRGKSPAGGPRRQLLISTVFLLLASLFVYTTIRLGPRVGDSWLKGFINIILVILPLWWFLEIGGFRLDSGSHQRQWGLINFSVFISLPVIILVEVFIAVVILGVGALWLIQQPEFAPFVEQLGRQFQYNPATFELIIPDLTVLLSKPEVIVAGLLLVSLVIPLVEESLKPLALWVLAKRNLSPAEGFTGGLVCGASFALLESAFSLTAIPSEGWGFAVAGRVATGLLHMVTAGLNGYALASSWRDQKILRLVATFTITVLIHGAWNFFAVMLAVAQSEGQVPVVVNPVLSNSSLWILGGLTLLMFALLFGLNRLLYFRETSSGYSREPPALD